MYNNKVISASGILYLDSHKIMVGALSLRYVLSIVGVEDISVDKYHEFC